VVTGSPLLWHVWLPMLARLHVQGNRLTRLSGCATAQVRAHGARSRPGHRKTTGLACLMCWWLSRPHWQPDPGDLLHLAVRICSHKG
jgi:hypothetical protein